MHAARCGSCGLKAGAATANVAAVPTGIAVAVPMGRLHVPGGVRASVRI
jgi:hypothetical protein